MGEWRHGCWGIDAPGNREGQRQMKAREWKGRGKGRDTRKGEEWEGREGKREGREDGGREER